jgi:hypothetical protein
MAYAKYMVIFDIQCSGTLGTVPAFTAGSVEVEGKNKALSLGQAVNAAAGPWNPAQGKMILIEAESASEAAKAVRAKYGEGQGNAKYLTAEYSNIAETSI